MDLDLKVVSNLDKKIAASDNILIIASSPVDYDCLGTALTIKWYIKEKYNKESQIFIFANVLESAKNFPGFQNNIFQKHPDKVNFSSYDLIILEDGNALRQFFTSKYEQYISVIRKENLYSIDHHEKGPIEEYIPENAIRVKDSCTSKIFYDYFIKPSNLNITLEVATWLYMSLTGDTGIFKFEIYKDTFSYAQMLLDKGVDHYIAVEYSVPKEMMDFTVWAIENTQYFPEAQTTVLKIDDAEKVILQEKFGKQWEQNSLTKYYENIYMHMVEGYNYSFIFKVSKDDKRTRVSWRCSALSELEAMTVLRNAGFTANGHRNAGGGISDKEINIAIQDVIKEITKSIQESKTLYTDL